MCTMEWTQSGREVDVKWTQSGRNLDKLTNCLVLFFYFYCNEKINETSCAQAPDWSYLGKLSGFSGISPGGTRRKIRLWLEPQQKKNDFVLTDGLISL